MIMKFITRIAPSPTGAMHIGTARTALFNWLIARATGGIFIVRIDDTDENRNQEEVIDPIYEGLHWLGLNYDLTFRQSARRKDHQIAANNLLEDGHAIRLSNGAIALKGEDNIPEEWEDEIAGVVKTTDTNREQINGRLILLKGDEQGNAPTYQFSSILDDYDYDVNYIVRGVDHQSNCLKQLAIWNAINKTEGNNKSFPKLAHIGLIFKDGKKLSKRDGASGIPYYKEQGYSSEALFAFLLRLGWSPKVDDKDSYTMSPAQAISQFLTAGRMRNSNAQLDMKKLDSIQKKFMAKQRTLV